MSTDSKPALVKVIRKSQLHPILGEPSAEHIAVYTLEGNHALRTLEVTTVAEPGPDHLVLIAGCVLTSMKDKKVLAAKLKTSDDIEHQLILNNMYCVGETPGEINTFEDAIIHGYDSLVGVITGDKLTNQGSAMVISVLNGTSFVEDSGRLLFMFIADGPAGMVPNVNQEHPQSWVGLEEYLKERTKYHPMEDIAAQVLSVVFEEGKTTDIEKAVAKFSADLADVLCDEEYFYSKTGADFMKKYNIARYFKDHVRVSTKSVSQPVDLVSARVEHVLLYESRDGVVRDWVTVPVNQRVGRQTLDDLIESLNPDMSIHKDKIYTETSNILRDAGFFLLG